MSKIKQDKIFLTQDENGNLHMTEEIANLLQGNPNANAKYKLVRDGDGLTKYGQKVGWVEWNEDSTFKELHNYPLEGRSLILDPHRMSFTWLTTTITKVLYIEPDGSQIRFNTENSTYTLTTINTDE